VRQSETDARFGSKTDIEARRRNVRFTPEGDIAPLQL
jgi:hypothetical protein